MAPRRPPASSATRALPSADRAAPRPGRAVPQANRRDRTADRAPAHARGVPTPQTAARPGGRAGFVLYVGLSTDGAGPGTHLAELAEVAESLRDLAQDLLPTAETYTALSLVPGTGADDVRDLRDRLSRLEPLGAGGPAGAGASAGTPTRPVTTEAEMTGAPDAELSRTEPPVAETA
ncbi:MAG TPA: hypothetical protein VGC67_08695 [Cellulomonas sp.]